MKKDNLRTAELNIKFSNKKNFRKSELRDFYRSIYEELDEKVFRRFLYSLEKEKIISKVDTGIYVLSNNEKAGSLKNKFIPKFSSELVLISNLVQKKFPYTKIILWETRILHEFMLHQPGQNLTILETEKESTESVFNFLDSQFTGRTFFDPNVDIVEKYVLHNADSILILPMISRSPHQRVNGIPCPKLEKILVDVWSDKEKFFMFHGQELENIYETAFHNYQISERTFFWYARRRKVDQKIRAFITQETSIQLIRKEETNR
jgi:hypothetical protein